MATLDYLETANAIGVKARSVLPASAFAEPIEWLHPFCSGNMDGPAINSRVRKLGNMEGRSFG